jgi:preprotein translocase subunit SecG
MYGFLITVLVLVCVTMIAVILMQSSKGGGLAGVFGGGQAGAVFGVRRTADLLTRITVILAATFMVLSIVINLFFLPGTGTAGTESILQRQAPQTVPPAQIPNLEEPSVPAAQPGTDSPGTEERQQ